MILKQHISTGQLQQLTPEQQDKLRKWWSEHQQQGDVFICLGNDFLSGKTFSWDGHNKPFNMSIPLLSIGQCIELLESRDKCINVTNAVFGAEYDNEFTWEVRQRHLNTLNYQAELIDALWEAVKSIL